jgi:hypothetical protein
MSTTRENWVTLDRTVRRARIVSYASHCVMARSPRSKRPYTPQLPRRYSPRELPLWTKPLAFPYLPRAPLPPNRGGFFLLYQGGSLSRCQNDASDMRQSLPNSINLNSKEEAARRERSTNPTRIYPKYYWSQLNGGRPICLDHPHHCRYWLVMVAVVPLNFVMLTVNGSL